MRVVVSLRLRLRETIRWTASTLHFPLPHIACITSFSRSVRGGRTRAANAVQDVLVQTVPVNKFVSRTLFGFVGGHKRGSVSVCHIYAIAHSFYSVAAKTYRLW